MSDSVRILLIEDDDGKRQSIETVLSREVPNATILCAHSVRSALDHVVNERFQLILADMSLPTYDILDRKSGGTPRPFGGIEVFEQIERLEHLIPILVVTSYPSLSDGKQSLRFEDLEVQLKRDFPQLFAGLIYFDFAYSDWDRLLSKYLSQLKQLGKL